LFLFNRLRSLLDSALLEALSVNQTQLILSYAHLALGGTYLPASNEEELVAIIKFHKDGLELELNSTGEGNLTVNIEGVNGGVQVRAGLSRLIFTVYIVVYY